MFIFPWIVKLCSAPVLVVLREDFKLNIIYQLNTRVP